MSYVASGITGASPIWNKVMRYILEKQDQQKGKNFQEWPVKPDGVAGSSVCSDSGFLPGDSGCTTRYEYFLADNVPVETENLKRQILINKGNQQPIEPGQNLPPENTEMQEHNALIDLTNSVLCLDCPFPTESAVFNPKDLKR